MSTSNGRLFLDESDFVDVVGADGEDLPAVPKHWEADQLSPGARKKSAKRARRSEPEPEPEPEPGVKAEPDDSWTNDEIVAYAAEHSVDLGDATKKADMLSVISVVGS